MIARPTATIKLGLSADLLKQIIDSIKRHADARRIVVYGSRARGDYGPTSDIDIAVECEGTTGFIRSVIDDEVRTLLKLDIVDIIEVNDLLRREIGKEGIVIYERT